MLVPLNVLSHQKTPMYRISFHVPLNILEAPYVHLKLALHKPISCHVYLVHREQHSRRWLLWTKESSSTTKGTIEIYGQVLLMENLSSLVSAVKYLANYYWWKPLGILKSYSTWHFVFLRTLQIRYFVSHTQQKSNIVSNFKNLKISSLE